MAWGNFKFIKDTTTLSLKSLNDMLKYLFYRLNGRIEEKNLDSSVTEKLIEISGDTIDDDILVFNGNDVNSIKDSGRKTADFLRSDVGDTVEGNINFDEAALSYEQDGDRVHVVFPKGAYYMSESSSVTGALKIVLPQFASDCMLRMTVHIYNNVSKSAITVFINGYNYLSGSDNKWSSESVQIITSDEDKDFTVRFGDDGTKACIYIGETTTAWSYPQVMVTDFYAGYNNATQAKWAEGWSIGFVTSFHNVDSTIDSNLPVGELSDSGWQSLTLINNWVDYGGDFVAPTYRKLGNWVYLRGVVKSGNVPSPIAKLPIGYRPTAYEMFLVKSYGTTAHINVHTYGNIRLEDGDNTYVSLSGISFLVN